MGSHRKIPESCFLFRVQLCSTDAMDKTSLTCRLSLSLIFIIIVRSAWAIKSPIGEVPEEYHFTALSDNAESMTYSLSPFCKTGGQKHTAAPQSFLTSESYVLHVLIEHFLQARQNDESKILTVDTAYVMSGLIIIAHAIVNTPHLKVYPLVVSINQFVDSRSLRVEMNHPAGLESLVVDVLIKTKPVGFAEPGYPSHASRKNVTITVSYQFQGTLFWEKQFLLDEKNKVPSTVTSSCESATGCKAKQLHDDGGKRGCFRCLTSLLARLKRFHRSESKEIVDEESPLLNDLGSVNQAAVIWPVRICVGIAVQGRTK